MKRITYLLFISLLSLYCIDLYIQNDLNKYVNPRYIGLTLITAIIALGLSLIGLYIRRNKLIEMLQKQTNLFGFVLLIAVCLFVKLYVFALILSILCILRTPAVELMNTHKGDFLLLLVIGTGFILPTVQLQSVTAQTRLDNLNSFQQTNQSQKNNIQFIFNTDSFTLSDWITTINTTPQIDSLKGKSVRIIGFIFKPELMPEDYFIVGRFVVRCCAVDAIPSGLYVKSDMSGFAEDDWVDVTGIFDVEEINGTKQLFIKDAKLIKTEMPKDPYIYI